MVKSSSGQGIAMDLDVFAPIIAKIKDVPVGSIHITPDLDIINDLSFDSLAITEFLYSIEETLFITLPFERLRPEHVRSLGALRDFLVSETTPPDG
jgi:acyl carrier protein